MEFVFQLIGGFHGTNALGHHLHVFGDVSQFLAFPQFDTDVAVPAQVPGAGENQVAHA